MKEPIWFKINAAVYSFQYIHKLRAVLINNDIHLIVIVFIYLFLIKNNGKLFSSKDSFNAALFNFYTNAAKLFSTLIINENHINR